MTRKNKHYIFIGSILICIFLVNTLSIYLVGPYAWDDGAITLAYAKTLVENGKFSLTAMSDIVEGTSSLLLTGLMAVLHYIFHFNFVTFIVVSQVSAYIFLVATAVIMCSELKKTSLSRVYIYEILALFFLLPMFTAEIQNGMEMTLFGFLITLYYLKFNSGMSWILVLTPLILLTRFEAIFYLEFSFAILFLISSQKKRIFLIGFYTLAIFVLISFFRITVFDDILPNTIWAKMSPPYSSIDIVSNLLNKINGGVEFFKITLPLLITLSAIFLFVPIHKFRNDIGAPLIFSFATFTFITGKNWGYDGRMTLACLPILMLLTFRALSEIKDSRAQLTLLGSNRTINFDFKLALIFSTLLCLLITHFINISLHKKNVSTAIIGGYYQRLLPSVVEPIVAKQLGKQTNLGVTPQNYRITGNAVDMIRIALNKKVISFMVPDVGGLGLCCSQIKVIDSALLTNKELAKNGYKVFDQYLSASQPDVIETHSIWSEATKIYDSSFFQKNYLPIVFENNLLWLRSDLYNILSTSSLINKVRLDKRFLENSDGGGGVRYADSYIDIAYLFSLESIELPSFTWKVSN